MCLTKIIFFFYTSRSLFINDKTETAVSLDKWTGKMIEKQCLSVCLAVLCKDYNLTQTKKQFGMGLATKGGIPPTPQNFRVHIFSSIL